MTAHFQIAISVRAGHRVVALHVLVRSHDFDACVLVDVFGFLEVSG